MIFPTGSIVGEYCPHGRQQQARYCAGVSPGRSPDFCVLSIEKQRCADTPEQVLVATRPEARPLGPPHSSRPPLLPTPLLVASFAPWLPPPRNHSAVPGVGDERLRVTAAVTGCQGPRERVAAVPRRERVTPDTFVDQEIDCRV